MDQESVETGYKDCENRSIKVGDTVECFAPIFTKPKQFVMAWDSVLGSYNFPKCSELASHCRIITEDEKH